ncbi:MAG: hypothetical protein GY940_21390 [bacterium]|nr:hypothetical protein [bacterium]
MEKIERTNSPGWLAEKWEEWGKEWKAKFDANKDEKFSWRQYKKKDRKALVQALSAMTQAHCSFCDAYHMGRRLKPTIEHFKPKYKFPLEAYKWENLFLACSLCQEKGDQFDEGLLKPDEAYYSFDKYFDIDWLTGELIPNKDASREDRERAKVTISLYQLNDHDKPEDRLEELEKFELIEDYEINKLPYRFFLKRGSLSINHRPV